MTHTNHREGNVESLREDWVVMMLPSRGINDKGAGPKLAEFLRLSLKYQPINGGPANIGNAPNRPEGGWQKLVDDMAKKEKARLAHVVLDNTEKVVSFLSDLARADLGLSVVISGLRNETHEMCGHVGLRHHTVSYSLGVWGRTELLPHPRILELTTMCGHGLVSFNLVRRVAARVRNGGLSLEDAAAQLAGPCVCGVFNTVRAQSLIQQYIACEADQ